MPSAGASLFYGVVTTGKTWEFGKLEHDIFTVDPVSVSAADNLQKTFNNLNWICSSREIETK